MDALRRGRLSARIAGLLLENMGEQASWSRYEARAVSLDGKPASWLVTAHRAGARHMILQETISRVDGESRVVRHWDFSWSGGENWHLKKLEKNHVPVDDSWINDELEDVYSRLEEPSTAAGSLEVPETRPFDLGVPPPSFGHFPKAFRFISSTALFLAALMVVILVNSLQYHRVVGIVRELDSSIGQSSIRQAEAVGTLAARMEGMDAELGDLRLEVERERQAFEFSRKNTAMTLRQQADALPWSQNSRKRAYYYLADRIETAGTYGEIIHQLSRAPEDNAQAETLLAVDRANIVPLASYETTIPGFVYPVRLDGGKNDGADFMISSGFGELRPTSLGSGGWMPHMAIDIINVVNILTVTSENSIVRFPGEPGSVVTAHQGIVIDAGFDRIYGWYMEIDHSPRTDLVAKFGSFDRITTFYAHMAESSHLEVGDDVGTDEKIGNIGETGNSTGPHLHFETRVYREEGEFQNRFGRFDRVNPFRFIPESS